MGLTILQVSLLLQRALRRPGRDSHTVIIRRLKRRRMETPRPWPRFPRILQSPGIANLCNSGELHGTETVCSMELRKFLKTAYISHSRPAILPRILPSGAVPRPIFLHSQRLLPGKFVANTKCSRLMAFILNFI